MQDGDKVKKMYDDEANKMKNYKAAADLGVLGLGVLGVGAAFVVDPVTVAAGAVAAVGAGLLCRTVANGKRSSHEPLIRLTKHCKSSPICLVNTVHNLLAFNP